MSLPTATAASASPPGSRPARRATSCTTRVTGFDLSAQPDPYGPAGLSGQHQHGRGLVLIRTFMDEVTQREGRNSIALMKRGRARRHCG